MRSYPPDRLILFIASVTFDELRLEVKNDRISRFVGLRTHFLGVWALAKNKLAASEFLRPLPPIIGHLQLQVTVYRWTQRQLSKIIPNPRGLIPSDRNARYIFWIPREFWTKSASVYFNFLLKIFRVGLLLLFKFFSIFWRDFCAASSRWKWSIMLQVTATSGKKTASGWYCCKWPLQVVKKAASGWYCC